MLNLNTLMGIVSRGVNTTPISISGLPAANRLQEEASCYEEQGNLDKAKECFETGIREAEDLLQSTQSESELRKTREQLAASHFYYSTLLRKYDKLGAEENYKKALEHARHMDVKQPGARMLHQQISARYGSFLIKDKSVSEEKSKQLDSTKKLVANAQPSKLCPTPLQRQVDASIQEKSKLVDYLFEKALSTLGSLKVSNKPSLFLVYAHDNPDPKYGQTEAHTSKYLIEKLSQIRVNLYSDQTPMGQTYLSSAEELKEDGKLEDILTNQLCLLPHQLRGDVKPVNKVVVCCSEALGRYLEWSYYEDFYQELREAYLKDCELQGSSAIREVVKKFSQEQKYKAGFHHVLTEIAFLQIRAEHWQDQHGIIPVSLTPNSYEQCLAHFIPATTVRMEDMPRLDAQTKAGEVYPNQSRHGVLFKVIERLLVSSNEAKTFLDKFWQGYSECISRLKDKSSTLGGLEFVELVDSIFGEIERALHSELALTVQQQHQWLKHQQEIELRTKKEPLAILGENIEGEYFSAWEEPGEIQDGLAMYVALQATTLADKKTTFNLDEAVTAFLTQKNDSGQKNQVLLLRGEAGSGKSTFNRQLARRLWREYGAATASDEMPIALYISLPTIDQPNKNLIGQYLSDKCGFSPEQIEALRQSQRFILILDGYDEIPAEHRNLYADGKLDKWQAKIIVSSRPEYLTQGYQNDFQPRGYARSLLEYEIAPFSEEAIETYIDQYVKHACPPWTVQDYQDALSRVPNAKELLGTPFLLKIALIVLPTLGDATLGLTRIKLYEQFVQTWFERSLARLNGIGLTEAQKIAFYRLREEGFIEHSQAFNSDFALAMSEAKTTVAEYFPIPRRGMPRDTRYEAFLSNKDEEKNLLRFSALLIRQQQQYRFIHKSIQDYLVARALWEELSPHKELKLSSWLNRLDIVNDPAVLQFLAERVQQERVLKKCLLRVVEQSKGKEKGVKFATSAANAITVLVKAGVYLSGLDLSEVNVQGADLSYGVFDQTRFEGTDLTDVNLQGSWLRGANLNGADLARVQFNEKPPLYMLGTVYDCCYSPDGRWFAVVENDAINLYEVDTLEWVDIYSGHKDKVTSIAFSPNSDWIVSGSYDSTVKLWNVLGKQGLKQTYIGHQDAVWSVAFSPDGKWVASGSDDKTLKLWDVSGTQDSIHTYPKHKDRVADIAFSPNGQWIASIDDNTIKLWNISSPWTLAHTYAGDENLFCGIAFSPDEQWLASSDLSHAVNLWNVVSGERNPVHRYFGHGDIIQSIAFSHDSQLIASGSEDSTVKLWSVLGERALIHTYAGQEGSIYRVAFSPDRQWLAYGGGDGKVMFPRVLNTPNIIHAYDSHDSSVKSVEFSRDGRWLASGSWDKTVRLWDLSTDVPTLARIYTEQDSVNSISLAPDGQSIVSGIWDGAVKLWSVSDTTAPAHNYGGHDERAMSVSFSPDGKWIASGSNDRTIKLWDAVSADAPSHVYTGHEQGVTSVSFSPDGKWIASGSYDATVKLWHMSGERGLEHTYDGHKDCIWSVAFSPNGHWLASGSGDETVRLWSVLDPRMQVRIYERHKGAVESVAFSPDSQWLASGSADNTVRLWSVRTGDCQAILEDFVGSLYAVAWGPSLSGGWMLATGGEDKAVRFWRVCGDSGQIEQVKLEWTSLQDSLTATGALIGEAVNLSESDRLLLGLRGAVLPDRNEDSKAGGNSDQSDIGFIAELENLIQSESSSEAYYGKLRLALHMVEREIESRQAQEPEIEVGEDELRSKRRC